MLQDAKNDTTRAKGLLKAGGSALLLAIGFGAAALLIRTAGGLVSLLKRTRKVHMDVDIEATKNGE